MATVTGTSPIRHTETRRVPRSTGALSGLLVIVLGFWGGLIPFIGPYFHYTFGSYQTWHYTSERLWLSIIPGAVAVIGGLMLLRSSHRSSGLLGGWLALAAGAWFAIGPAISLLWHSAGDPIGAPMGGHTRQAIEWLGYFSGLGVAIAALAAFAMGRYFSRPRVVEEAAIAGDEAVVAHDERVAERDAPVAAAAGGAMAAREARPLGAREEPVAAREEPVAAGEGPVAAGEGPVAAGEEPVAAGEEPVAAGEGPGAAPEEPLSADESARRMTEPMASGNEPVAPTDEAATRINEPVAPANEPMAPAGESGAATDGATTGSATDGATTGSAAGGTTTGPASVTYRRRPGLSRFRR